MQPGPGQLALSHLDFRDSYMTIFSLIYFDDSGQCPRGVLSDMTKTTSPDWRSRFSFSHFHLLPRLGIHSLSQRCQKCLTSYLGLFSIFSWDYNWFRLRILARIDLQFDLSESGSVSVVYHLQGLLIGTWGALNSITLLLLWMLLLILHLSRLHCPILHSQPFKEGWQTWKF